MCLQPFNFCLPMIGDEYILHTLDDEFRCHLFFFKFVLVVIFIMYSIIYTNDTSYYTNMRFHTFLLCNIFSVSTVTIQRIFFRILRGASCLRTNLLDIFFDQVRVRRSRPLTSSAIFCESAQVVKMDEDDTKKRPFDCMCFFFSRWVFVFVGYGRFKVCVFTGGFF